MMRNMAIVLVLVVGTAGIALAKLGGGDIVFSVSGAASVLFSHDAHVGAHKIGCTECHYAVYQRSHASHQVATMADMQKGRSCGACHNGDRAFSVAAPQQCGRCHSQ
jgi:c(7)-type cytochrome triheme protein